MDIRSLVSSTPSFVVILLIVLLLFMRKLYLLSDFFQRCNLQGRMTATRVPNPLRSLTTTVAIRICERISRGCLRRDDCIVPRFTEDQTQSFVVTSSYLERQTKFVVGLIKGSAR